MGAGAQELDRAFVGLDAAGGGVAGAQGTRVLPVRTLEEIRVSLVERVSEWPR